MVFSAVRDDVRCVFSSGIQDKAHSTKKNVKPLGRLANGVTLHQSNKKTKYLQALKVASQRIELMHC